MKGMLYFGWCSQRLVSLEVGLQEEGNSALGTTRVINTSDFLFLSCPRSPALSFTLTSQNLLSSWTTKLHYVLFWASIKVTELTQISHRWNKYTQAALENMCGRFNTTSSFSPTPKNSNIYINSHGKNKRPFIIFISNDHFYMYCGTLSSVVFQ